MAALFCALESMSCSTFRPSPLDCRRSRAREKRALTFRKPSVYAGETNPPPFTMRLCAAFVNRKTVICSVFGAFFPYFSRFQWFLAEFGEVIGTQPQSQAPTRDAEQQHR
jgi:hypothetical protein